MDDGRAHRDTPGDLLPAVSRRLRREVRGALEPLGMTPHHARALSVIERDGPMRLRDLAGTLRIAPRSVTDVVDHLQDASLLTRSPDPGDRRATVITVTAEGRSMSRRLERARRAAADAVFADLSDADRAELSRILHLLVD